MFNKPVARRKVTSPRGRKVHQVTIVGKEVSTVTPEGQQVSMSLEELMQLISGSAGRGFQTGSVLPDGVIFVRSLGPITIWVCQRPPQVHNFRWIADDSPSPFGKGATYRTVRIALPYLIVLAVFCKGGGGRLELTSRNECFFRNDPLKSVDDELLFPALLNCSKFKPPEGHPLSWICTANMNLRRLGRNPDQNQRMRESLRALLHCLLETGYNRSSEHHEESSWFTESAGVDPRIATVEAWEKATAEDPLFVLDVPWLQTGKSLGQVIDRIIINARVSRPRLSSATDIVRLMVNNSTAEALQKAQAQKLETLGVLVDELF